MPVAATRGYHSAVYKVQDLYPNHAVSPGDSIIGPRYEQFLAKNPNLLIPEKHAQRIADLISTPQRDRTRSFSASSAGYCMRRQELAFIGAYSPPIVDNGLIRIFHNGTWNHLKWQASLLTAGILDAVEVTVKNTNGLARATLDGIGVAEGGKWHGASFFWEHKGRNSFAFASQEKKNSPDNKTIKQVGFQFWQTGFDVGVVTNENKNDQNYSEFVIEYNRDMALNAKNETMEMVRAVERQKLHPMLQECQRRLKTGEYYKCPFGRDTGSCVNSGSWPI